MSNKQFECPRCYKRCGNAGALKTHMKTHKKPEPKSGSMLRWVVKRVKSESKPKPKMAIELKPIVKTRQLKLRKPTVRELTVVTNPVRPRPPSCFLIVRKYFPEFQWIDIFIGADNPSSHCSEANLRESRELFDIVKAVWSFTPGGCTDVVAGPDNSLVQLEKLNIRRDCRDAVRASPDSGQVAETSGKRRSHRSRSAADI